MYPYRNSNLSRYKLPIETITLEQTINNPVQTASHRIDGVLIIKGSPVQDGKNITNARIIDIAPTVLYLMGATVPEDMDGRVITEAINPDYLNSNPISYSSPTLPVNGEGKGEELPVSQQAVYNKDEEKQIEETLRSLGYID